MARWPDTEKNFKRISQSVAVVTIKSVRPNVDGELSAQPDVDHIAVGKITHITERDGVDRKNLIQIAAREDELMPGFLDALPARINRVAVTLII